MSFLTWFTTLFILSASSITYAETGITCTSNAECDDGLYCNGAEHCVIIGDFISSSCQSGPVPNCDDGDSCTNDSCNEYTDSCRHLPLDEDADGHLAESCGGDDCDDADGNRYPGNVEICDSENHDEDCNPSTFGSKDTDLDGFIDDSCCNQLSDLSLICGNDCDDASAQIHPHQVEVCNSVDDNCSGDIDEGLRIEGYPDTDGDNYGDSLTFPMNVCPGAVGFSYNASDCDDSNPAIRPGSMRCTLSADLELCGSFGEWEEPVSCPNDQVCIPQPNGTGICVPLSSGGDIDGDGKIGLPEAIHALGVASGMRISP